MKKKRKKTRQKESEMNSKSLVLFINCTQFIILPIVRVLLKGFNVTSVSTLFNKHTFVCFE